MASSAVNITRGPAAAAALRSQSSRITASRSVVQFAVQRASNNCGSALSWTNSHGFGRVNSLSTSSNSRAAAAAARAASLNVTAFTPEQSKLVKDSWKTLQKDDAGKWALKFFIKVFEIAPSVKRMFSFLKDSTVPLEKNPKLKVHALQVFTITGQAATQLGEKGGLDSILPKLLELGHSHVDYGVVDEHFDVVGFALLATLQEALGDQWTPEMKEAWATAYNEVVLNIKKEMEVVRLKPQV